MTAYQTGLLVILALNVLGAFAVYLPLSAGQLNLGIAGFMAVGAYAAAWLGNEQGWGATAAIAAGGGAAALVACAVAVPILRTHGIYLALATFALGQVITAVFLNLEPVGAAAGYPVTEHIGPAAVLLTTLGVAALVLLLSCTRFALCLTAIRSDAVVADLMGMPVRALKVAAFTLGAAIAGLSGGLYALHYNYVEAQHFGVMLSTYTVLYVLLGGTRSVWGPILGAAFFTLIPELLRASAGWRYAIFALLVILFMAWRPAGLLTGGLRLPWRRRAAEETP
ncbi:branched-chain amino acid ABC transporter permease [Roseomonas sp. NAR14]|uniref:Branched-chain amino acid ABC transporter permease n=1 Tax=Roseomonas acroporae TaxID=2937791 RepID=A0A9X2BWZ3_9PROT|nr:branched-chain amino acid ABC transporter permease [Roseomonas acroporae]MCK8784425.1 branched-chain amino acid ABC transporter permease [Roseomonas acroporae]